MKRILQAFGYKRGETEAVTRMASSSAQKLADANGCGEEVKQWVSQVTSYSSQYDDSG